MEFCIRDDDTSFFTSPDQLEAAYGEITRWGPVSLAIVPFHRAGTSKGVPEKFRGEGSIHPLHKNAILVKYLRERVAKRQYEIMLHGYYHDEPNGRAEFAAGEDLLRRAREGREYLETVLGTPLRVFVPPRNSIGRNGLRAIARAGLHLAGTAGVRCGWPLHSYRTWRLWLRLRRWQRQGELGIPWVLNLGDHREIPGNAVTPVASLRRNHVVFNTALRMEGVFCAATHYWELGEPSAVEGDPPVGKHLRALVERAVSTPQVKWRSVGQVVSTSTFVI